MNIIKFERLDGSTPSTTHKGEFIDILEFQNGNYLVTRRIDPYSELNDRLEVTEIIQDWYLNGICISYGNNSTSVCTYFEDILNKPKLKEKVQIGWLPFDILDVMELGVSKSSINISSFSEESKNNCVGLIDQERFCDMKDKLERVGEQSLYQLQSKIDNLTMGAKSKK